MATKSGKNWPFDDPTQVRRMAKAFGWPTDPDWATKSTSTTMPKWATDQGWETDPRWVTRLKIRSPFAPATIDDGGRLTVSLGYHPDLSDFRDRSLQKLPKSEIAELGKRLPLLFGKGKLPEQVNHIPWCSPVEDQGKLGSCTAQAVVGLMEYMQRRGGIQHVDGSRLFIYKVSRKLQGWTGDTGAYLRTAMKAVAAFGVPPEQYWPYVIENFEEEPSAFLYAFASNYQALKYTRLDPPGVDGKNALLTLKRVLATGLGAVFGFPVYSSLTGAADIPFPTEKDRLLGGHAVMAVGYDDGHGKNGALIIRNSWGQGWGYSGYGFLPYEYVEQELAQDFWTVLKAEWLNLEQFEG